MKYEINKSRLETVATKYLLSQLGQLKNSEIPTLEIFENNGRETAMLIYSPEMNAYYFNIEEKIFSSIMDTFLLSDREVGKIVIRLVYDLTGVEVVDIGLF